MGGYSSTQSPMNDLKCTYRWLGRALFRSQKYGQLCTPDGETVNQVTLPVNTNARMDYETSRTKLAPGDRRLHPEAA